MNFYLGEWFIDIDDETGLRAHGNLQTCDQQDCIEWLEKPDLLTMSGRFLVGHPIILIN